MTSQTDIARLLTAAEVAAQLGVPTAVVRMWAKREVIPALALPPGVRKGGRYRFDPRELVAWQADLKKRKERAA